MTTVLILNGPNLGRLGSREPEIYGSATLGHIQAGLESEASELGLMIDFRQTNHEGDLIDWLHEANEEAGAVILNAGAYTHSSIAIRDAVAAISIPVIEVHLSNVHAREEFRRHSYLAEVAHGIIAGFGAESYSLALSAVRSILAKKAN